MIRKTGNRAFAALNRILSLPGTQALGQIDISVAQPVYELNDSAKHTLARTWLFSAEYDLTAPTDVELVLPWDDPTAWDNVVLDGTDGATVTITDPSIITALATQDIWVWQCGITVNPGDTLTRALVNRVYSIPTGPTDFATFPLMRANVFHGTGGTRGLTGYAGGTSSPGPVYLAELPWYFPASARTNTNEFIQAFFVGGSDSQGVVNFRVTTAPPGLFSQF